MAEFSGNIHSVTFMDYPQNSMVEVLYSDPNDKTREGFIPWHMEVDFTQDIFKELLEEVSLDKIEQTTIANIKADRSEFESMIDQRVRDKWKEEEAKLKAAYNHADKYAEDRYKEADTYVKEKHKEHLAFVNQISDKVYKEADKYAEVLVERKYKEADKYAEDLKGKKYSEVQEEFKAYRKELQGRYQDVPEVVTLDDITGKDLFQVMVDKGKDNDFIFAAKVAILEDQEIAKSKDKALKLSIRKSKTLWELFKIYFDSKG